MSDVSEQEAYAIGMEAYFYLYPLITFDLTRRVLINHASDEKPGMGPPNAFHHMREYPSAAFKDVVRPNFDTLYSLAWLDLTAGPLLLSVPDTAGRYYLLPIIDMWTDVVAVPGKRTTGTAAATFAIVPPGWHGQLPPNVPRIDVPTRYAHIAGRTQTNGPTDYPAVHEIQDGYVITNLDGSSPAVPYRPDPAVDMATPPLIQLNTMPADQFFAYGAELLKLHPPHVTDWSIVARMARIGLQPGQPLDLKAASPTVTAALSRVPTDAVAMMQHKLSTLAPVVNGWQMNTETMGVYGNAYLKRAIVAMVGIGANPPEDAIYPLIVSDANGAPVTGTQDYVLHFAKSQLPPVEAFWSITMYDDSGFPIPNPINRYAIGDRDDLRFNDDGSLDIYVQHESPRPARQSNWLPAPTGPVGITMRLYAPTTDALTGRWNPPPLTPSISPSPAPDGDRQR